MTNLNFDWFINQCISSGFSSLQKKGVASCVFVFTSNNIDLDEENVKDLFKKGKRIPEGTPFSLLVGIKKLVAMINERAKVYMTCSLFEYHWYIPNLSDIEDLKVQYEALGNSVERVITFTSYYEMLEKICEDKNLKADVVERWKRDIPKS